MPVKLFVIRMSSSPKKRQRSQGQRQRAKNESAFNQLFTEYQAEMDARNDIQERIYKSARDVIIESKRVIFILQRCSRSTVDEWEEIFIEANLKIDNIKKKILEIRTHIGQSDQFMFNRAFDFAIEEFIEAIGFYWFLKEGTVPTLSQMENMVNICSEDVTITKLAIDHTTYVFGLADVTGEVMRYVTNKSEPESAKKSLDFLREIYDIFVSIQEKDLIYRSKNMSQKVSAMLTSVKKIEMLCYRMTIRQLEFGDDEQMLKEMIKRDLSQKTPDVGYFED